MRMQIRSLASLSGLRIQGCHLLWCRLHTRLGFCVAVAVLQASSYSSNLTPSLGTSLCCEWSPKKQKKKKKKKIQTNENNYLGLILINCHEITYLSPPSSPIVTGRCIVLCHHSLSINGLSFKKERRDHKSFKEFWIGVPKKKRIYYNSAARVHNQNIHLANQWRQQLKMGISF